MMLRGWVLVGLAVVVGFGAPGDIYQWTYDQLTLGPGWRGHVFANRTGQEVVGLELLLAEVGQAQVLVVGGHLVRSPGDSGALPFTGRVVPGGVVTVALPEGTALHGAAWITAAGRVPIEIEPPIPRLEAEHIYPLFLAIGSGRRSDEDGLGSDANVDEGPIGLLPPDGWGWWDSKAQIPVGDDQGTIPSKEPERTSEIQFTFVWPPDLDPALLRAWEGYPYLVRLDARRSFSPVGKEIVAWRWTWEDGLVQEGPVVVRGFDRPGIYWVRLTVTDSAGRIQALTRFVEATDWEAALADWLDRLGLESAWREITTKPMETRDPNAKEALEQQELEVKEGGELPGSRTPKG